MKGSPTVLLSDDEGLLGAYEYLNLHCLIKYWPPISRSEISRETSLDKRLHLSLARYAYIHETRHFHDFFGTLAGASLFFAHFKMLRSLIELLEMMKQTNEKWSIPFPSWADTSQFRDIHTKHLRSWSLYRRAAMRFTGAFTPGASPSQHTNDFVVYRGTEDHPKDFVATFPFDIGIPSKGIRLSVYYPISLIALLEGNAQAIQRSLVEAEFPPELADRFTPQEVEHRLPKPLRSGNDLADMAASSIQPYNVTDFMVSKYMRLARGNPSFRRENLVRLTDITLSSCGIVPSETDDLDLPLSFQMTEVGREFVSKLEGVSSEHLATGDIAYPPVLLTTYSDFLEGVLDFPRPDEVEYKGDLLSPPNLLESILRHEVIAPLMQARIKSNHSVFYSVVEYMRTLPDLPKIPVLEHSGGLTFAPYMCEKAEDAWSKYVFLSRLASELAGGGQILTCPRADGTVGGLGDTNFCSGGECRVNIGKGNCDGWYRNRPRPLPPCLFTSILKATGAT